VPVMRGGRRLPAGRVDLAAAREEAQRGLAALPEHVRAIAPAAPPYPVEVSAELSRLHEQVIVEVSRA